MGLRAPMERDAMPPAWKQRGERDFLPKNLVQVFFSLVTYNGVCHPAGKNCHKENSFPALLRPLSGPRVWEAVRKVRNLAPWESRGAHRQRGGCRPSRVQTTESQKDASGTHNTETHTREYSTPSVKPLAWLRHATPLSLPCNTLRWPKQTALARHQQLRWPCFTSSGPLDYRSTGTKGLLRRRDKHLFAYSTLSDEWETTKTRTPTSRAAKSVIRTPPTLQARSIRLPA